MAWVESSSRLSYLQLAVEVGFTDRKRKALEEDTRLTRLRAAGVLAKPLVWKGKLHNRLEVLGDEKGQKKAEPKERDRWARKVFDFWVSIQSPVGLEVLDKGGGTPDLRSRGACADRGRPPSGRECQTWAPFFGTCRATKAGCFRRSAATSSCPSGSGRRNRRARPVHRSLLTSLGFLEEAGEYPRALRLSQAQPP